MKTAPATALVLLAALLTGRPDQHHPHPVEQQPTVYIAAPTVAAKASAQAVTANTYYI
jgi:hypothetical protein